MAPDSNTAKLSSSRSTMVGMRPFGLSFRYAGSTRMRRKSVRTKGRVRRSLHRSQAVAAMLVLLVATGASAYIPVSENATLIPLPEIITDPNEGETVGALAVLLMTDPQGQV